MTAAGLIELRHGGARDGAAIEAIMAQAFDPRFGEAWTRNQCMGVLAMPGVRLTLAEVNGQAAGFALVRTVLDEAELLLLAVVPASRRQGIGGALMRAVVADAGAGGVRRMHLEVRANNAAVHLYRRHGFAPQGVRPGYYKGRDGTLHDAHTYARTID